MKKIVAIIGSNSKKSNTYYFTLKLLRTLKMLSKEEIEYEVFTGAGSKICQCQGCLACYINENCIYDNKDDMEIIKNKILEADLIILGSPVYVHNVSGTMKNFIDRIFTWTHTMRLAGKYGLVLTTTSNNGSIYVQDYLKSISNFLGLKLIGGYNIFVDVPNELYDDLKREAIIRECCNDIIKALENEIKSNYMLEGTFLLLKNRIKAAISSEEVDYRNSEIEYWCKTGNINCNSFQDVLDKIKN